MEVRKIDYKNAMDVIVDKHYLHRKCPCSIALGLFASNELKGVIVFGKPASYTLCEGIAGKEESKNVIEFNRLWVCDTMPRNTETWFIARALKQCPFEIIVSFADTEQNHTGYVYQAANWLYCGESKKQKYYKLKCNTDSAIGGVQYRRRARMSKEAIVKHYGAEYVDEYYSTLKYRYIFFNASKQRRKELLAKLRYKVLPYPKRKMSNA